MWRARLIEVSRVPQLVDNGIQRKALSGAADCTREKRHRFKEKKNAVSLHALHFLYIDAQKVALLCYRASSEARVVCDASVR